MLRNKFCRPDGRLIKLFLFSTLLEKSPLTSIYFTTFEKKSQASPTHTTKLFGFWYNFTFFDYMSTYVFELSCILYNINLYKIVILCPGANFNTAHNSTLHKISFQTSGRSSLYVLWVSLKHRLYIYNVYQIPTLHTACMCIVHPVKIYIFNLYIALVYVGIYKMCVQNICA